MKDLSAKIKLIFLPFLGITISFIAIYTFLHWLLFIQLELFSIKEMFLKFWLPFGLPYIPIYFFLHPRLKHLKFKNDNQSFGFQFLAVIIIAAPTMIAQEYLVTATGKLTPVDTISEIQKHEKTKYYTLKKFYIDKKNIGVLNTSDYSGKNNQHFNMHIYVAMPILTTVKDTSKLTCKFWLGKKYSMQVSSRLSNAEKQIEFKKFSETTEQEFKNYNFKDFEYLELEGNTEDHDNFDEAIEQNTQYDLNEPLLLIARHEPFKNRNGKKLLWFSGTLGGGILIWFVFLIFIKIRPGKRVISSNKNISPLQRLKQNFDFLIPKKDFYITPILINLNLAVFILMVFSGYGFMSFKGKDLLIWGANFGPFISAGQYWRLFTSIFLHGGIMHLFSNMVGLYIVGLFLEPLLGKTKYLILYCTTGILASLASIWWYEATVSVGASGAIFGLYGFFLASLLFKVFPPQFGKAFLGFTLIFIGYNLVMGLMGGIDNAAHIGGLLSGFVFGFLMSSQLREQNEQDAE